MSELKNISYAIQEKRKWTEQIEKNEKKKCIRNWPLPIRVFQDQYKQTMVNKHN